MVPETASTLSESASSMVEPFSTMLLCAKNIIQGAIVVPIMAMVSEMKLCSCTTCGTTVIVSVSPQLGWAKNAATTYVTNTNDSTRKTFSTRL